MGLHPRAHRLAPAILPLAAAVVLGLPAPATGHGPTFSASPQLIWEGGVEATLEIERAREEGPEGEGTEQELGLEVAYGLTEDWELVLDLPYAWRDEDGSEAAGLGDLGVGAKYRFYEKFLPGASWLGAGVLEVELPTGDEDASPRLGSGSTDLTAGITGAYQGRRWLAFADAIYRLNTEGEGDFEAGDRQRLDFTLGWRPWLTGYREPDTVLLLEANFEHADRDRLGGRTLDDTGGWQLSVSPGVFWTWRQFGVRAGVQVPVAEHRHGTAPEADYRARLLFVYHY